MAARALDAIECSVQPLDFAFHPSRDIIATGLVDGTIECKIVNYYRNVSLFFLHKLQGF